MGKSSFIPGSSVTRVIYDFWTPFTTRQFPSHPGKEVSHPKHAKDTKARGDARKGLGKRYRLALAVTSAGPAFRFRRVQGWSFHPRIFNWSLLASLLNTVLRRMVDRTWFGWWYGGICQAFGLIPLLALAAVESQLSRSVQLSSTLERFRVIVVLTSAVTLPYLLLFPFIVLALRSPLYRHRLSRLFGIRPLQPEP